jgi:hypothetical protein
MGLFTGAGLLVPISGLSPFARSAFAHGGSIPTGLPPSPLFNAKAFDQAMPRFDIISADSGFFPDSGPNGPGEHHATTG